MGKIENTTQNVGKRVIMKVDYVKKDNTCPLYIHVSVDGEFERIPLKLPWPKEFFDKKAGKILPRFKDDKDCSDYQLMIDTEVGKINEIFKEYRLGSKILTIGQLLQDYNSFISRKDFFTFAINDIKERHRRGKIELGTRKGNLASINNLKEYWAWEQGRTKKKPANPEHMPFRVTFLLRSKTI